MYDYSQATIIADTILKEYDLCDSCLGRLFSRQMHLSSNQILGKKLRTTHQNTHACHICRGLFFNMDKLLDIIIETSKGYSFSTFGLGAILKPSTMDRDDHIRSKYSLKGSESIKTGITGNLSKLFAKRTKKILDCSNPDITITLNLKDQSASIRSKSLIMYGRYIKNTRGITQKQKPCQSCSGNGCVMCGYHGITEFDSVEGVISKKVFESIGGTRIKFTWIGGEDKSSLVLGEGRPFFIQVKNPRKRDPKLIVIQSKSITVDKLVAISKPPESPIAFESVVKIRVLAEEGNIDSNILKRLKTIPKYVIIVYDKFGKQSEKRVTSLTYRKSKTSNRFTVTITADSGLPIKRFVLGDDVAPGITQTLGVQCRCDVFDFLDIRIHGISLNDTP